MWRDRSSTESVRVARYWDRVVTGGSGQSPELMEPDIDPTLVQTISWLERIDDARPASLEFSRQFEAQFLNALGTGQGYAEPTPLPAAARPTTLPPTNARRDVLRLPAAPAQRRRLLAALAAGLLLFLALGSVLYLRDPFGRSQDTGDGNVILAPSTAIDVPMDRGNAQRSGVMPGPGLLADLTLRWSFEAGRGGISAPALVGDTIFVTSGSDPGGQPADQGAVIAIDAATGSERWRFPAEHAMGATPAVAGGIVYAGDAGGILYALDARTGEERWRKVLPSGWTSEPVVVGDAVYIVEVSTQAPLHLAVQDGTVVVGSGFVGQAADGFRLSSFDRLTGEERWRSGDDISGQPGLFAFDADDGAPVWQFAMPSLESGPALADGYVFAGSTLDTTIYALELASGEAVWQADIGDELPLNSAPAVSDGQVFVTTAFGSIFCLDASTGEIRWQAAAEHASVNSSAVVVDDTVYVVDTAYGVSALSVADGAARWSQQLDLTGQVVVSPVVVNGTIFIGTSLTANSAYAATLWALAGSREG